MSSPKQLSAAVLGSWVGARRPFSPLLVSKTQDPSTGIAESTPPSVWPQKMWVARGGNRGEVGTRERPVAVRLLAIRTGAGLWLTLAWHATTAAPGPLWLPHAVYVFCPPALAEGAQAPQKEKKEEKRRPRRRKRKEVRGGKEEAPGRQ